MTNEAEDISAGAIILQARAAERNVFGPQSDDLALRVGLIVKCMLKTLTAEQRRDVFEMLVRS